MAVDSYHNEYEKRVKQWQRLHDCYEGQDAIHSGKTKYLPKLSGQTDDDYKSYLKRTVFYGATGRTVDGLTGMIFRKDPQIEVPVGLEELIEDVTLSGLNLVSFLEEVVEEGVKIGRCGILVDHPSTSEGLTVAQAQASNIRPFLKLYTADQITNWRVETVNNAQVVTEVRLFEYVDVDGEKEFEVNTVAQIRVLDIAEGVYRQRIFRKTDKEEWLQFGDDIFPMMRGKTMNKIPFFFVGVKSGSPKTEKPPLIDLADVNLSHYMTTADLEHGAHFTGLPTAIITGHTNDIDDPDDFTIGSMSAWVFDNAEADAKYLEFTGQGLDALERRAAKKEEQMALLGARMLSPEKRGVEATETAQIHRMGETSVLASLSMSISKTMQDALTLFAEWARVTGDIKVQLNTDFMAVSMTAQKLTALLQTWQSGGMAYSDFLRQLKKGEIIDEDRDEDEIRSDIETENPFQGQDLEVQNDG